MQCCSAFADECAAGVAAVADKDACTVVCVAGVDICTAVDADEVLHLLQMGRGCVASIAPA
jgi:hypothetical protein